MKAFKLSASRKQLREFNEALCVNFGERLLIMLGAVGMTRRELAIHSGLSYDGVLKLVRGKRGPSLETVAIISTTLGLTVPEFLCGPVTRK